MKSLTNHCLFLHVVWPHNYYYLDNDLDTYIELFQIFQSTFRYYISIEMSSQLTFSIFGSLKQNGIHRKNTRQVSVSLLMRNYHFDRTKHIVFLNSNEHNDNVPMISPQSPQLYPNYHVIIYICIDCVKLLIKLCYFVAQQRFFSLRYNEGKK